MSKIIAFSGRKQSGKSTGSQFIQSIIQNNNINLTYQEYSFADPLKKDICMNILGLTHEQCYGSDEDKNTMTDLEWAGKSLTAREAMEVIGTDIFRKLKNNVWVDATIMKIQKESPDMAIIPDCRFPNEVDSIKRMGGYVIRLDLDPFNAKSHSESALDPNNYSWNNFDIVIRNHNMTIEEKNYFIFKFLVDKKIFTK